MKKLRLIVWAVLCPAILYSQQTNSEQRYIDVTAKAEMEVIPDEIYLGITLTEYEKDRKKVNLEEIDKQFYAVINGLKIDPKNLEVESIYGGMRRRKKSEEFRASKTYRLKMADLAMVDALLDKLDEIGISQTNILEVTHSKMQEFRLSMKMEAVKTARAKAEKMMGAINEQIGKTIFINEINNDYYPHPVYANSRMSAKSMVMDAGAPEMNIEMKKIKIHGEVSARFEIK